MLSIPGISLFFDQRHSGSAGKIHLNSCFFVGICLCIVGKVMDPPLTAVAVVIGGLDHLIAAFLLHRQEQSLIGLVRVKIKGKSKTFFGVYYILFTIV